MRRGIIPRATAAGIIGCIAAAAISAIACAPPASDIAETVAPKETPTMSPTATVIPQPSPTPETTPTATRAKTATATPSATPTPTANPRATEGPPPTSEPTVMPTATVAPTATQTPIPTLTPTHATATSSPEPSPTHEPTATVVPEPSPTPEPTGISALEPSPTPEPTAESESSVFLEHDDCTGLSFQSRLPLTVLTIMNEGVALEVEAEVADDGLERSQGLMCRRILPDGTGMLFAFAVESPQSFWMFNTYLPLDIVYLDTQKLAFQALTMEPCPRPEAASDAEWQVHCGRAVGSYTSSRPAKFAIELPAGWLERNGIPLSEVGEARWEW